MLKENAPIRTDHIFIEIHTKVIDLVREKYPENPGIEEYVLKLIESCKCEWKMNCRLCSGSVEPIKQFLSGIGVKNIQNDSLDYFLMTLYVYVDLDEFSFNITKEYNHIHR